MLSAFGGAGATSEDVDGSGNVDVNDLLQLLSAFGSVCAAAAPSTSCGQMMGMCNMMCHSGFQCANNQYWDPMDGVAGQCVDQSACSVAVPSLPPGLAIGRPFLSAKAAPMTAEAIEHAISDWMGMAGPKDDKWQEYVKNIKDPEERAHAQAKYEKKPPPSSYRNDEM